jgi:hypothetical protein
MRVTDILEAYMSLSEEQKAQVDRLIVQLKQDALNDIMAMAYMGSKPNNQEAV